MGGTTPTTSPGGTTTGVPDAETAKLPAAAVGSAASHREDSFSITAPSTGRAGMAGVLAGPRPTEEVTAVSLGTGTVVPSPIGVPDRLAFAGTVGAKEAEGGRHVSRATRGGPTSPRGGVSTPPPIFSLVKTTSKITEDLERQTLRLPLQNRMSSESRRSSRCSYVSPT